MRRVALRLVPLLCLALPACGGGQHPEDGRAAAVECAPFARALTGVRLAGPAADWWREAQGRYTRSQRPETGSLLVLRRSARLPSGHVAVVSRVLSPREILVTQANWVHHRVAEDQPVIDISPDGDWTAVRVWWPPSGQMGVAAYPAFGFIRPDHPAGHDRLIAGVASAVRVAEAGY